MFFERYGDSHISSTAAKERLDALKRKIKEKSSSSSVTKEEHPQKRKRTSSPAQTETCADLVTGHLVTGHLVTGDPVKRKRRQNKAEVGDTEIGCVSRDVKKKKKTKIKENVCENESYVNVKKDKKSKHLEALVTESSNDQLQPVKKKKKRKEVQVILAENGNLVKKEKKKKNCDEEQIEVKSLVTSDMSSQVAKIEPKLLTDDNNGEKDALTIIAENGNHVKKKKKKKNCDEEQTEVESLVTSDMSPQVAKIEPKLLTDDNNGEKHASEEEKGEGKEEEKEEKEKEWTVLGKNKVKEKKLKSVKRDLPDWILCGETINTDFDETLPLEECECLDQCVKDLLIKMDISSLFPIQSTIVPHIISGCQGCSMVSRQGTPPSDVCVSAPTGSGKTLVYVLPMVQVLYKLPPMLQGIIVVPTKNLANQVRQVLIKFDKLVSVALLSGKDTFPAEQKHLFSPQGRCLVHIAVTTPGRLVNHIRDTPLFTLQHLRFLVIDEMDTLLNQNYQDWIPALFSVIYNTNTTGHPLQPHYTTTRHPRITQLSTAEMLSPALPLQKMLFSATLTHDPSKLGPLELYQPKLFSCGGKYIIPSTLEQWQVRCTASEKPMVVMYIVRELGRVLCFSSSVDTTHRLAILADEYGGVRVKEYSSSLSQQERNRVVRDFNAGVIDLLVCSDSLARGMDLSSVDHVLNYDVPVHVQTYVHRVGRTARAGRVGHAYTLIKHEETRHFHQILKKAGDSKAKDWNIPESVLEEMSEQYEKSLENLKIRLKNKKQK